MQPSSQPSEHPESKSPPPPPPPPPPAPGMGYPPNPNGAAYYAATPPPPGSGNDGAAAYPYPAPPQPHYQQSQQPPYYPYPYPYPAPDHQHQHYPPYPPAPAPAQAPATNLRRLLAIVLGVCLFLAAVFVIVYLVLRPRTPIFSLTSLTVSGVAYVQTNSTFSASFDAALVATNPNTNLVVTYFSPLASFSITPGYDIAVAATPPFSQAPGNTTTLAFRVAAVGAYLGSRDGAAFISGSRGTAEVEVTLATSATFERGSWLIRRKVFSVRCGRVPVVFPGINSTEASFTGPARWCKVL